MCSTHVDFMQKIETVTRSLSCRESAPCTTMIYIKPENVKNRSDKNQTPGDLTSNENPPQLYIPWAAPANPFGQGTPSSLLVNRKMLLLEADLSTTILQPDGWFERAGQVHATCVEDTLQYLLLALSIPSCATIDNYK